MTVPNFLSTSFAPFRYYQEKTNNTANILTTLTAELVTNPAAPDKWTEAPAGTFQSPSDASGRWMKCAFSSPAANKLQMVLTDNSGNTICSRRANSSGNFTVRYYTGKFHCYIEIQAESTTASYSYVGAWLMDCTPDTLPSCPYPVVGNGLVSNTDVIDGFGALGYLFAMDNAAVGISQRMKASASFNNTVVPMNMASGRGFFDECLVSQNVGGTTYWTGRLCQTLWGPGFPLEVDVPLSVPVDDGTMATFAATAPADGSNYRFRMWIRKA